MSAVVESQCMQALARANEIRAANALLSKEIRSLGPTVGLVRAARVLRTMEGESGAMPIARLLLSVHRLGDRKAGGVLRRAGISLGTRRIRDLTQRQRDHIADWLDFEHERRTNLEHFRA